MEYTTNEFIQNAKMSVSRQISYIIENAYLLNRNAKSDILRLVMLEYGDNYSSVIMEKAGTKEISINLDKCKKDLILHVYNIVKSRVDLLNQPIKQ
jgi:hypothetical protein